MLSNIVDQEASDWVTHVSESLIAWDVGMIHESINHDSTTNHVRPGGERASSRGDDQSATHTLHEPVVSVSTDHPINPTLCNVLPDALDGAVVAGHRLLNPERTLRAGEWLELLIIQRDHGAGQILMWQARASRSTAKRPSGVTPAYYHACAARGACATNRPGAASGSAATNRRVLPASNPFAAPICDPAREVLLQAMGVRERKMLGTVPHALIAAWADVITHPGLTARFDSPVGFAVQQMRQGQAPPPNAELDRWAERRRRTTDRYETWGFVA